MAVEVWSIPSTEMYSRGGGRNETKEVCGVTPKLKEISIGDPEPKKES